MGGACSTCDGRTQIIQDMSNKPKRSDHVMRSKRRDDDNIKMGLTYTQFENVSWIHLAYNMA
jgi:hypothetical protein